jgi:hypothetical protein
MTERKIHAGLSLFDTEVSQFRGSSPDDGKAKEWISARAEML